MFLLNICYISYNLCICEQVWKDYVFKCRLFTEQNLYEGNEKKKNRIIQINCFLYYKIEYQNSPAQGYTTSEKSCQGTYSEEVYIFLLN